MRRLSTIPTGFRHWLLAFGLLVAPPVMAVTGVNPSGVNVKHNGVTTVFLTFQSLGANEQAVEAFWCGEVTTTGVSVSNPCVPGTFFGKLPARHNLSQISGVGNQRNLTDIMTIPASVARRAFQAAAQGADSDFFYVRRFTDGVSDSYVTVTCRMAGGGARTPLALTKVQILFNTGEGARPVYFLSRSQPLPEFGAWIQFTGTGRLKGRWEVVLPGDPEPTPQDLLTEATLPVEQRPLQRRYTLIDRFDRFLPPTGSFYLPGPNPELLPRNSDGPYKILLRIEATADKEGNSNTLNGVAVSGGVAGFALPVLRYYVGSQQNRLSAKTGHASRQITLLTPASQASLRGTDSPVFSWVDIPDALIYELQVQNENRETVLTAYIKPGISRYAAPPWLLEQSGRSMHWRIRALTYDGAELTATDWRIASIEP